MGKIRTISEIIEEVSPYYKKKGEPETKHTLVYESSTETLEPIYFFLLDLMDDFGLKPEKLVDNFTTSPGSGHFSEQRGKATHMQQQGITMLGHINTVLRSILNIVYDLRDFRIRLQSYDDLDSGDNNKREGARLALKQIWMDKVDIIKGNSSIKALALGQAGFQTLLDAFLIATDEESVDKLDLNERVKRILKPRIQEFNYWIKQSEVELRKRYEVERNYLRSQVNSLKLYSRWAKPYLKAAQDLEMKEQGREASLVKIFNTILLELTLFGKSKVDVKDAALAGDLPVEFQKIKQKRNYYSCVLIDFKFRGIPQRVAQQPHFAFGGKAEITFRGYALNDDEIAKLEEEMSKSEIEDVLQLIEGATDESLKQIQDEIDYFLKEQEKSEEKVKKSDSSNPFLALIGRYDKKDNGKKENKAEAKVSVKIRKDDWIEKTHLRALAVSGAEDTAFNLFDIYKKAHGMASYT